MVVEEEVVVVGLILNTMYYDYYHVSHPSSNYRGGGLPHWDSLLSILDALSPFNS